MSSIDRKIYDISRSLTSQLPVWPGSRAFDRRVLKTIEKEGCCESEIALNIHTGTHMDAPSHFVDGGVTAEALNLNLSVGPCEVISFTQKKPIDAEDLKKKMDSSNCRRWLLKTANSIQNHEQFDENFVAITSRAAQYLVDKKILFIGIDGPSIQLFHDKNNDTHEILLSQGIAVAEGLDLKEVVDGPYDLVALPLKIEGAEGAPARIILMEKEGSR